MTAFRRPLKANSLHAFIDLNDLLQTFLQHLNQEHRMTALNYKYLYRNKPPWCSVALSGGHRMFMQTVTLLKSPSRHRVKITSIQSPRSLSLSQHRALSCRSVSRSLSSTRCTWDISQFVSNGRPIYTLSTGAGSVKRESWTALVAYSWFSTDDEALFQQSTQKSAILWLSFHLSLPIMERGQIRPFSQICVLQKHTYAVEPSVLKE